MTQYRQGHDSLIKEGILSDPASLATHLCSQLIGKQRSIKDCQGPVHMQVGWPLVGGWGWGWGWDALDSLRFVPRTGKGRCLEAGVRRQQASLLGWRPVVTSWLQSLPAACVKESLQEHVLKLFDWLVPPLLRLVTKDCQCPVHMQVGWPIADDSVPPRS